MDSDRANAEAVNDRAKLIIHRFAARAIMRDPSIVAKARQVVASRRGDLSTYDHVAEWERLLELPPVILLQVLVRRDETMDRLRTSSPFPVLLDIKNPEFRLRLWRKARAGLESKWKDQMAETPKSP